MITVIGSKDHFLSLKLGNLASDIGFRVLRTHNLERIVHELKQPQRLVVMDLNWEEAQAPGVLRRLVNISRVSRSKVVCVCPNMDEDLKKLARSVRPDKVFLRYDIETLYKEYLQACSAKRPAKHES